MEGGKPCIARPRSRRQAVDLEASLRATERSKFRGVKLSPGSWTVYSVDVRSIGGRRGGAKKSKICPELPPLPANGDAASCSRDDAALSLQGATFRFLLSEASPPLKEHPVLGSSCLSFRCRPSRAGFTVGPIDGWWLDSADSIDDVGASSPHRPCFFRPVTASQVAATRNCMKEEASAELERLRAWWQQGSVANQGGPPRFSPT